MNGSIVTGRRVAEMMRGRHSSKRPDPLVLLAVAVTLGVVITAAADAGERFLFDPLAGSAALISPDAYNGFSVARVGNGGVGVHISLTPPPEIEEGFLASGGSEQQLGKLSDIFISIRYPW